MKSRSKKLRKAIIQTLGITALAGLSNQVNAAPIRGNFGAITESMSVSATSVSGYRAFSDYAAGINAGWTHTAAYHKFQIGSDSDLLAGNRFDVSINVKSNANFSITPGVPVYYPAMQNPGFSVWTSGTTPTGNPAGGHVWNQVQGAYGTNAWMTSGNILSDQEGWVGYANAGYTFINGAGDHIAGLLTPDASNTSYYDQLSTYNNPPPAANVNQFSSWVDGGNAITTYGDATLNLVGLKAGYYLIGIGNSCPDDNYNGQNCNDPDAGRVGYTLTIDNTGLSTAAVPIPGASWLFVSALATLIGVNSRKKVRP